MAASWYRNDKTDTMATSWYRNDKTDTTATCWYRNDKTDTTATSWYRNDKTDTTATRWYRNDKTFGPGIWKQVGLEFPKLNQTFNPCQGSLCSNCRMIGKNN
jgi:antitoxin component YwqK of YwqJK toxin-antitoxin module